MVLLEWIKPILKRDLSVRYSHCLSDMDAGLAVSICALEIA